MKSRVPMVGIILLLITSYSIAPIIAQGSHSLEWGVEIGEEFTYALQRKYVSSQGWFDFLENQVPFLRDLDEGQKATMEVTALDQVPETIENYTQMPLAFSSLIRENDSENIVSNSPLFVVPVGDWVFLTNIGDIPLQSDVTLIDDADEWGTISTGSFIAAETTISYNFEIRYEKENGTLTYLSLQYSALGNSLVDVLFVQWLPGMPTVVAPDLQITTILIIALAGTVVVIVAFLVYRYIKGKKSIARRLGE